MLSKRVFYPALTGLRAIAASMILFHHYWQGLPFQNETLIRICLESHIAVVFFFVLSGFLVTVHHHDDSTKHFFWNRVKRIFPLYLVVIIPILFLNQASGLEWLLNLTLLKGFFPQFYFSGNSPTWAITVELSFYLIAPFILATWTKTRLWQKAVICFLISMMSTVLFNRSFSVLSGNHFLLIYTIFGRLFEFILGMWLGFKLQHSTFSVRPWKTIGGFVAIALSVSMLIALQGSTAAIGLLQPYGFLINNYLVAGSIMLFIWGLATESSWFSKLFSTKIVQLLGNGSYAFFLIHLTLYAGVAAHFAKGSFWLFFIFLWVAAIAIYKWIELPLAKLVKKL